MSTTRSLGSSARVKRTADSSQGESETGSKAASLDLKSLARNEPHWPNDFLQLARTATIGPRSQKADAR